MLAASDGKPHPTWFRTKSLCYALEQDSSAVNVPPKDAPEAAPRVPLDCSTDAMHGRCFGFESERENWDAPLRAVENSAEARPGYNSMSKSEYLDTDKTLRAKARHLARLLRRASCPVFYCGAGLSTAAGIGDYASSGGPSVARSAQPSLSSGADSEGGSGGGFLSPLCAQPTAAHRVLAALHEAGMMHRLIQQNHDGLPQKAGLPQHALNEIHGACHSPDNPVVPMSGGLREDLFADLLACEAATDLAVAVGTSLCGMNADRVVATPAAKAAAGRGLGAVVIGLQRTVMDADATLRIFATVDAAFAMLAEELQLAVPRARPEGEFFRPAILRGCEAGGDAYELRGVPYDAAGRRLAAAATGAPAGAPAGERRLDLRDGAQLVIPTGMHAGAAGEVDGYDREGNPRCRFNVRLKPNKRFKAPFMMVLGTWHLQAAVDATVAQLPVVNVPASDDDSAAARDIRALVAAY